MLSPSQGTQHKVTRSITTLPGWDASPSQDTQHKVTRSIILLLSLDGRLVHHRIPRIKWLGVLLLFPGWDASPSQDTQHKVTGSITTLPGWEVSPSQDTQLFRVTRIGVLLLPLDWMPVQHRITSIKWHYPLHYPLDWILVHRKDSP